MTEERPQRRLAAILAADVVGYTRLMDRDEAGTLARLKTLRRELFDPRTEAYGGRIFKNTGDGALVEFPSATDAVQTALDIQRELATRNASLPEAQRIVLRVGISLGDVIVDGDDLFGTGVNVAARMEALAEPGGICVSANVYEHVAGSIEAEFEDLGEQTVKNLPRPVRCYRLNPAQPAQQNATAAYPSNSQPLALPDKPSIAVLPFENLSGDPEQEFFADGMTEDIITELSRFENLFVIARNTTFTYKGQRADVKQVARDLGVHFVLEGSVRKMGQRVRITAQLINGRDGGHVWAERYDGALEEVFDLQEQVTSQVVGSIAPQISHAELEHIGRGESVFSPAHELAWKALGASRSALHNQSPEELDYAITLALQAFDMNPKCGVAYQTISTGYSWKSLFRWGEDPTGAGDLAEEWGKRYVSQFPNSYMAYLCLALARFRKGEFQDAMRDFRYAHELNPNDSETLRVWAWCEAGAGIFDGAREHADMAIRLSPKDPRVHVAYLAIAMAAFIENDAEEFESAARKAIAMQPAAPIRRAMMIAYAAEAGNEELLHVHRDALMRSSPDFIASLFRGENKLFQRPEHMERLLNGLRKAGMPETE